jgi:hypothetical protein
MTARRPQSRDRRPGVPRASASLARVAAIAAIAGASAAWATVAGAQRPDSTRADTLRPPADSLPRLERLGVQSVSAKPPISPRRAFLYSFLVPGLGQARLDRPNGGALFATIELGAIAMAMKSHDDLRFARDARSTILSGFTVVTDTLGNRRLVASDSLPNRYGSRLRARRLHFEDWIAVLVFNHLFAGADAFVAAQLWDMPVRGSLRAAGPRSAALAATLEFGGRRPR